MAPGEEDAPSPGSAHRPADVVHDRRERGGQPEPRSSAAGSPSRPAEGRPRVRRCRAPRTAPGLVETSWSDVALGRSLEERGVRAGATRSDSPSPCSASSQSEPESAPSTTSTGVPGGVAGPAGERRLADGSGRPAALNHSSPASAISWCTAEMLQTRLPRISRNAVVRSATTFSSPRLDLVVPAAGTTLGERPGARLSSRRVRTSSRRQVGVGEVGRVDPRAAEHGQGAAADDVEVPVLLGLQDARG